MLSISCLRSRNQPHIRHGTMSTDISSSFAPSISQVGSIRHAFLMLIVLTGHPHILMLPSGLASLATVGLIARSRAPTRP